MPNQLHTLKRFTSSKDALYFIDGLYTAFKIKHQRNPSVDPVLSTVSKPSLHGDKGQYRVNEYGKMLSPKKKDNFNGTIIYSKEELDYSDVTIRWTTDEVKQVKDADWIKAYSEEVKLK